MKLSEVEEIATKGPLVVDKHGDISDKQRMVVCFMELHEGNISEANAALIVHKCNLFGELLNELIKARGFIALNAKYYQYIDKNAPVDALIKKANEVEGI